MENKDKNQISGVPEENLTDEISAADEIPEGDLSDENSGGGGENRPFGFEFYDWAKALATAVIIVVIIFTFFFRIVGVKGSSMVPTLHDGDKILLQCMGFEAQQGDIVVLTKRSFEDESIIKRVIATEGQTVDIDFTTGQVWVDGVLLDEPYIAELTRAEGDMTFPLTVKEGCVFVMGDNRNASTDSRVSVIGQVDERCIIGKLALRLYPFESIGKVN